jgi:hypothetical protein
MHNVMIPHSDSPKHAKSNFSLFLGLFFLTVSPSCQDYHYVSPASLIPTSAADRLVQEGEITLSDGEDAVFQYEKPFASPPRLVVVEYRQSQFLKKPFTLSDFQFVEQKINGFKIRNLHDEHALGAWATIKWRAEGTPASAKPANAEPAPKWLLPATLSPQEKMLDRTKQLGGAPEFVPPLPTGQLVGLDLHGTRIADADLDSLEGLSGLKTLNLHDTHISNAGLKPVGGLTNLQKLYLNDTTVSDAGMQSLRGLTDLSILGLNNTRVTDAGLHDVAAVVSLRELSLSGAEITDRGVSELKCLKNLKLLVLTHTKVTLAGVQDLKKALPGLNVVQ